MPQSDGFLVQGSKRGENKGLKSVRNVLLAYVASGKLYVYR
jgi:hypothetical protein